VRPLPAIGLHLFVVALIIAAWALGLPMVDLPLISATTIQCSPMAVPV